MKNRVFKCVFMLCVMVWLVVSVFATSGCAGVGESIDQLESVRDQASEIQSGLNQELDELSLMRESIPDGSAEGASIDSLISQIRVKLSVVDAAIVHADQVIGEARNPSDPLTIAADSVSPFVPAPLQAPLVLGAALVASVVRSRSLQNGTRSIIESIEHVMKKDDSFKAAFVNHADTIRTIQTPVARKLVKKMSH
ncbi:MAG: hypothetical protein AB8C13_00435 [Phycisphaerales bacterium]